MNIKERILDLFNLYLEKKTSKKEISKVLKKLLPYKIDLDLLRIGEDNDGGYLVPNDISGIKKNYTAGVGDLTKFEKDLEEKFSINSNMLDLNEIDSKILPSNSEFKKKKLGIFSSEKEISINDWLNEEKNEILLKMDIEGDEYLILSSISDDNLKKIRVFVIELHDLRHLRNYFFFKSFDKIFSRLNNYFYVCHLHPNNSSKIKNIGGFNIPDMVEITLIRKDRVKNFKAEYTKIPHELDQKTVLNKDEVYIDKNWYY